MDGEIFKLITPCHFGLEAVTKREILDLGLKISDVSDGRVEFEGSAIDIARANIFLRTGERVLLKIGSFKAESYEDLFQGTKALPWGRFIPKDAKFWVAKANTIRSKLFSRSDIQRVMKKAMVDSLSEFFADGYFPETGEEYPVRVFALKDQFTVCLDTTGDSLHKRGYRLKMGKAPITETLAASLIMLSNWRDSEPFLDPMCGSGTFPIEAALISANIAPGMNREFLSEKWSNIITKKDWYRANDEALGRIDKELLETGINKYGKRPDIQGFDIDGDMIDIARENAERAEVLKLIHFEKRDIQDLSHKKKGGTIVTNPPYGERIEDRRNLPLLYTELKEGFSELPEWNLNVITAWEHAEKYLGKAQKNRKIYNGMMKTYFYQYRKGN